MVCGVFWSAALARPVFATVAAVFCAAYLEGDFGACGLAHAGGPPEERSAARRSACLNGHFVRGLRTEATGCVMRSGRVRAHKGGEHKSDGTLTCSEGMA